MPYLVMEPDGSKSSIRYLTDDAELETYLRECSEASEQGVPDPRWLDCVLAGEWGRVNPGAWREGSVLIVEVARVVVPKPVTTRWAV